MAPHRATPQTPRGAYLAAHAFELFTASLAIFAAAAFFAQPDQLARSAVGQAVHPFDYAWNVSYGLGGILVTVGILRRAEWLEVAGLSFFAGAVLVNGVAIFLERGLTGLASAPPLIGFAIASVSRIAYLWLRLYSDRRGEDA
jgi:hypothetical protein